MRPNFLMIGAMKCGTSTVSAYLERHPDVFMPPKFEPNFFCRDEVYAQGTDWYEAHFADHNGAAMVGEGSNNYASGERFPDTAARIKAYRPDMKLIYIVRNPLERLISAWIQVRADSADAAPPTLDGAVLERPEMFVDQSCYGRNLARYQAHFPSEQIFVGFMEDMKADPDAFFASLTAFLGVSYAPQRGPAHVNPSAGKKVLSPTYSKLRRLPVIGALGRVSPRPLKRFVKQKLLSQKITARPSLSPQVHAQLTAQLCEDTVPFLAAQGKPADFWSYE